MAIPAVVVLVSVVASSTFAAGPHVFTTLVDTKGTFVTDVYRPRLSDDPPSINNAGKAAFSLTVDGPFDYDGLVAVSTSTPGIIGFMATGEHFGFLNTQPVINDSNIVMFSAQEGPNLIDFGVFKGDGTVYYTKVVDNHGGFSVPNGTVTHFRVPPDMNNAGTVAFAGALDSGIDGVYTGTGGALTTITDNESSPTTSFYRPSINSAGTVAYHSFSNSTGRLQIHTTAGGGTLIADTDDGFKIFGRSSINDAGTVVFNAEYNSGVDAVLTGDGGPLTTVVDSSGPLDTFPATAINNSGDVAYLATYDVGKGRGMGIFNGPDSVLDKVIGIGGSLSGSIVTRIDFGRNGFNDSGQIAFAVRLKNGHEEIVRSTPNSKLALMQVYRLAMLTTAGDATSVEMAQNVAAPPGQVADLKFDYRFLVDEPDSFLRVLIDGKDLRRFPGAASDDLNTVTIPVDLRSLFPEPLPDEVTVSFLLEGPAQTVHLDDITFDDSLFVNGDFETGDFTGWQFDPDRDGSALVVGEFVLVPEPTSLVLLMLALPGLLAYSRRRHAGRPSRSRGLGACEADQGS